MVAIYINDYNDDNNNDNHDSCVKGENSEDNDSEGDRGGGEDSNSGWNYLCRGNGNG